MYVDSVAKKDAPFINESAVNNDTDEPRAKQTSHVYKKYLQNNCIAVFGRNINKSDSRAVLSLFTILRYCSTIVF